MNIACLLQCTGNDDVLQGPPVMKKSMTRARVVIATFLQHSKERIDYGRVELRACSIEQHWIHFLPRYNKKVIPFLLESAELKKFNSTFQAPNPFLQMSMRYMPFQSSAPARKLQRSRDDRKEGIKWSTWNVAFVNRILRNFSSSGERATLPT